MWGKGEADTGRAEWEMQESFGVTEHLQKIQISTTRVTLSLA